jgi:hypothetical protein
MTKNSGTSKPAAPLVAPETILFDQFSRYESCAEAIRTAMDVGRPTVLDVGSGHARLLGARLPEADVSYLDPLHAADDAAAGVIAGSFERLRSDDRRWDWVVAVDTLEHIPPGERDAFLDTMIGCARTGIALSGPYSEDAAASAVDCVVNSTYKRKTGDDYSWLVEHGEYGLPALAGVRQKLTDAGFQVSVFGNGHAPWLEALLPLYVCFLDEAEHLSLLQELSAGFNEQLYRYDHLEPVYRRIVVAHRHRAPDTPPAWVDTPSIREAAAIRWCEYWGDLVARVSRYDDGLVVEVRDLQARVQHLAMEGTLDSRLVEFQSWAESANERAAEIERASAQKLAVAARELADSEERRERAHEAGEQAREAGERAREAGEQAHEAGERAREAGEQAHEAGERAREAEAAARTELALIKASLSWRVTSWLRWLGRGGR